jgi:hypothetical protein
MVSLPLHILEALIYFIGALLMFVMIRFRPKTFYFYFPLMLSFINGFLFSLILSIDMIDGIIWSINFYNLWSGVLRLQTIMTLLILLLIEYKKQFNGTSKHVFKNVIRAIKGDVNNEPNKSKSVDILN